MFLGASSGGLGFSWASCLVGKVSFLFLGGAFSGVELLWAGFRSLFWAEPSLSCISGCLALARCCLHDHNSCKDNVLLLGVLAFPTCFGAAPGTANSWAKVLSTPRPSCTAVSPRVFWKAAKNPGDVAKATGNNDSSRSWGTKAGGKLLEQETQRHLPNGSWGDNPHRSGGKRVTWVAQTRGGWGRTLAVHVKGKES